MEDCIHPAIALEIVNIHLTHTMSHDYDYGYGGKGGLDTVVVELKCTVCNETFELEKTI